MKRGEKRGVKRHGGKKEKAERTANKGSEERT